MTRLATTLLLALTLMPARADNATLQQQFNQRYQNYFGPASTALLPFPQIAAAEWARLKPQLALAEAYREPGKYYNGKLYTFLLQQAGDGRYYLEASGGFWGMDHLVYGPLSEAELRQP